MKLENSYNIGGNNQIRNIDVVIKICRILDKLKPAKLGKYEELIEFVVDRPGHDYRYGIDASKINKELNWKPQESFQTGIHKTVVWFLNNQKWLKNLK